MKNLFRLIVLVLLIAGWGFLAAAVHVVRTPSTLTIVTKDRLGFTDTYADTRGWTLADVESHPALVRRLVDAGKSDRLSHLANPSEDEPLDEQLLHAVERGLRNPARSDDAPATAPTRVQIDL